VNTVMGQIVEGTKGQGSSANVRQTWASQPGMIRTYDDKGNVGNSYKLYSAARMVIPGSDSVTAEMGLDLPNGWEKQTALFTDLNAPVIDAGNNLHFPIIDGDFNGTQQAKAIPVNGKSVYTYTSNGGKTPDIEGFGIDAARVPNFDPGQKISASNNPAA